MSTSDILDGAFKLLRANARSILLVVATFIVPIELLVGFLQRNTFGGRSFLDAMRDPASASSQSDPSSTYTVLAVTFAVAWLVGPIVCGGVSRVVMASYLGGELKPKEAVLAALRRAPALLVATILVHVVELIGGIACIIPILFLMPFFVMAAPAISIEQLGPIAGIRRSISLSSRRYWPTMGVALLAGVIAYFLGQILGFIPNLIALFIGLRYGWILVSASGILVSFITIPLITIVATLLYLDARIRLEGFDLQIVAADLDRTVVDSSWH
jgi:hypothetical protein